MEPDPSRIPQGLCDLRASSLSLGLMGRGMKMLDWPIQFAREGLFFFESLFLYLPGHRGLGEAGGLTCPLTSLQAHGGGTMQPLVSGVGGKRQGSYVGTGCCHRRGWFSRLLTSPGGRAGGRAGGPGLRQPGPRSVWFLRGHVGLKSSCHSKAFAGCTRAVRGSMGVGARGTSGRPTSCSAR